MSNHGWHSTLSQDITYEAPYNVPENSFNEDQAVDLLRSSRNNWFSGPSYLEESSAIIDSIDVDMQDVSNLSTSSAFFIHISRS